jgi:hypothetical protein
VRDQRQSQDAPDPLNIDFVAKRLPANAFFSGAAILLSVALLIFRGLNFGIDFTGGTLVDRQRNGKARRQRLIPSPEEMNPGNGAASFCMSDVVSEGPSGPTELLACRAEHCTGDAADTSAATPAQGPGRAFAPRIAVIAKCR